MCWQRARGGVLVALVLAASACTGTGGTPPAPEAARAEAVGAPTDAPSSPAGGTPDAPAARARTLERIAIPIATAGAPFVPHYLAQRQGFFREEGLEVEIPVTRANVMAAGMASGEIGYNGQTSPSVRNALAGIPVRMIAAVVNKSTRWIVSLPEVREMTQLRGQAIAINSMGDGLHNSGTLAVTHFGLDPHSDVSWIAVGGTPERLLTLQQGAAAATVVNAADLARAQALGFAPLLRLDDVAPLPESGLAASVAKLEGERDQVKRVLRAMVRALQYVKTDREGSLPAFMEFMQVSREDAARDYEAIQPSYSDDGTLSERSMRFTIDAEREQLKVTEEVPSSRVASFEPLYEVLAELGITPAAGSAR